MPIQPIHTRFKQIRLALGLSQTDFAHRGGLTQSQVSQIETGDRDISEAIYGLLAKHFKVNRTGLETGEGDLFTEPVQPLGTFTERAQRKPQPKKIIDTRLGKQLLIFRRDIIKISAEQLATELDVLRPAINKYENGRLMIPISAIVYLHDKYQMSYEWFFNNKGAPCITASQRNKTQVTSDELSETVSLLVTKVDYLEKQLNHERRAREKLQKDISTITIQN